ncbi:hypothetical protein A1F97_01505 [Pyrenophora tritici-repentis]|uniref:Tymo-45kd-70kd multi-domain protein n=1 Tax=Pyrenophora tritici-repentis TaxID=45151 RepID=A0A2W1EVC7_9PLEO|nr:Tymo-45kd-70kd multi-domain protein [Pyrenophora tritici-repentis]KAI1586408.1 hypothetical protein PtrEW7m1_001699 [Pyrenophora tritici-repentis]KAI1596529.1 hypothetical protein PtrEW13061_001739 [Pyrenophora tritici-repentis]KAI1606876.1 hypothetical protein PtrCC142_000984 [Pyrenophora tritici-repentis]PZC90002.1 hypothetical protein A1F95_09869 [Pyrenophora tritici-repentis]
MVAFRNIITAALALATPITAAISAAEVTVNIKVVTQKSMALQQPAQSISLVNGPLILIGQGPFPKLIFGFADIVTTATAAISQMQGMPKEPAGPATDAVFEAFREATLLNILIGKAGLFQAVPFIGQPIAAVLRQIEGVVDTIAFMLIATFEARASDFQKEASTLTGTLSLCIAKYDGLSVSRNANTMSTRRAIAV